MENAENAESVVKCSEAPRQGVTQFVTGVRTTPRCKCTKPEELITNDEANDTVETLVGRSLEETMRTLSGDPDVANKNSAAREHLRSAHVIMFS